jgi:SH3-like domain-containing protein
VGGGQDGDDFLRVPLRDPSGPTFRVTTAGLRLRASPNTEAQILIADLGAGSTVTAIDDELVTGDNNQWRHVRTGNGTVGWAAANFLQQIGGGTATPPPPKRFRVTTDSLRRRDQPSVSGTVLTSLPLNTVVTEVDNNKVKADGIEWHHVRAGDGAVGWMSREPPAISWTPC